MLNPKAEVKGGAKLGQVFVFQHFQFCVQEKSNQQWRNMKEQTNFWSPTWTESDFVDLRKPAWKLRSIEFKCHDAVNDATMIAVADLRLHSVASQVVLKTDNKERNIETGKETENFETASEKTSERTLLCLSDKCENQDCNETKRGWKFV